MATEARTEAPMIDKPSDKEDEWIKEQELKRLKRAQQQLEKEKKTEEEETLKQLHWMHCPKCGCELETVQHHNIAIDKCTRCEGLWLDKGELESLIALQMEERKTFFDTLKKIFR